MLNRVSMIGRLTRDPELRTTTAGQNVCSFSIAVPRNVKPATTEQPEADFFRVTAWGPTADYVNDYLSKGRLIVVDGRLESRKFTDRDGNNREVIEIIANQVTGLDRPRDDTPQPEA